MDITKDTQPVTSNQSAEVMRHLRETKRPVVLTINGKATAVVQDAEAYHRLLDTAARADASEGISQGLDDLAKRRGRPARCLMRSAQSSIFHVEIVPRASRDLQIYGYIHAESSHQAYARFNALVAAIDRLDQHPARGPLIPESRHLHQLLHGKRPHVCRIICAIDHRRRVVSVVHIRPGARDKFAPGRDR
jgi:prevent-host-death family protein